MLSDVNTLLKFLILLLPSVKSIVLSEDVVFTPILEYLLNEGLNLRTAFVTKLSSNVKLFALPLTVLPVTLTVPSSVTSVA